MSAFFCKSNLAGDVMLLKKFFCHVGRTDRNDRIILRMDQIDRRIVVVHQTVQAVAFDILSGKGFAADSFQVGCTILCFFIFSLFDPAFP